MYSLKYCNFLFSGHFWWTFYKEQLTDGLFVGQAITGDSVLVKFEKARRTLEESLKRVEDIVPQSIGSQVINKEDAISQFFHKHFIFFWISAIALLCCSSMYHMIHQLFICNSIHTMVLSPSNRLNDQRLTIHVNYLFPMSTYMQVI